MNDKFFKLPIEKQQKIINAAYQVFSQNSYKKAPMSEIADAGGISKALLFHYFTNKKELYMYLWNTALEQTKQAAVEFHVTETDEFFEMLRRSLLAKCSLMRKYPYLYLFSVKAFYEQEPDIKLSVGASFQLANTDSEAVIWEKADFSDFRKDIDIRLLYRELLWVSDGYLRQMASAGALDADRMEKDFLRMISQWEKVYLK